MNRYLIAVGVVGIVSMLSPASAQSPPAQLMVGDSMGRNVTFIFDREGRQGLRIETRQVGNPGARLSIWIDHGKSRLFSRILTTEDCKYGDNGATCRIAIPMSGRAYARFIDAFSRGRTAHVEVQNAAVMQMSSDVSLIGFARRLRS